MSTGTRTKILDSAQELIQRRGINGMSFSDISEVVGIRKPSIHHHFASKQELVETLLERYRNDFDVVVNQILASKVKGRTKFQRYMSLFEGTIQAGNHDKGCLCGMLAAELSSLSDGSAHAVHGFLDDNVKYIKQMLDEGKNDGSLDLRGSVDDTASMVLATLEGGLMVARAAGGPKQMSAIVKQILTLLAARP